MTIKGNHYEKGQRVPEGERKLYLIIEGPTELVVKRAKVRIRDRAGTAGNKLCNVHLTGGLCDGCLNALQHLLGALSDGIAWLFSSHCCAET